MSRPPSSADVDESLRALRELLAQPGRDRAVLTDAYQNETMVRGDTDPVQLDPAIRQSGLGLRAAVAAAVEAPMSTSPHAPWMEACHGQLAR